MTRKEIEKEIAFKCRSNFSGVKLAYPSHLARDTIFISNAAKFFLYDDLLGRSTDGEKRDVSEGE